MNNLKIDPEFQSLIPPLSDEEFHQLEENVKVDGCRDALVTWNGTIIDGHNRYRICQENNIPFKMEEKEFSTREDVIEWMLKNQLGRRNLNDFQRNEVALRYQGVIADQMKKRQATSTGGAVPQLKIKRSEAGHLENTTQRKELAKIAGTSEGSLHRSRQILEKGTTEQIDRARKGGKGNSVNAIYNEVAGKQAPAKMKPTKAVSSIEGELDKQTEKAVPDGYKVCSSCHQQRPLNSYKDSVLNGYPDDVCGLCIEQQMKLAGRRMKSSPVSKESRAMTRKIIDELGNVNNMVERTVEGTIEEIQANLDIFIDSTEMTLRNNMSVINDKASNEKIMTALSEAAAAIEKIKGKYSYEKL